MALASDGRPYERVIEVRACPSGVAVTVMWPPMSGVTVCETAVLAEARKVASTAFPETATARRAEAKSATAALTGKALVFAEIAHCSSTDARSTGGRPQGSGR
jgi:hypothetical protein